MTTPSLPDALRDCIEAANMVFGTADEPMATGAAYRCAALIRQHGPALEALLRERESNSLELDRLRRIEAAAKGVHWFPGHFWDLADGSGCHISTESMQKFDAAFNELGIALGLLVPDDDLAGPKP